MPFDGAVGFSLDAKYPFAANKILRRMRRDQFPGVILEKSIKLKVHGLTPFGALDCRGIASGFRCRGAIGDSKEGFGKGVSDSSIGEGFGFADVVLGSGCHMVRRRRVWSSRNRGRRCLCCWV